VCRGAVGVGARTQGVRGTTVVLVVIPEGTNGSRVVCAGW
jgi:hypothetical protein